MKTRAGADIDTLFRDDALIDAALRRATRAALLLHKRMGQPIVVWDDGQVREIPPEKIVIPRVPPLRARNGRRRR